MVLHGVFAKFACHVGGFAMVDAKVVIDRSITRRHKLRRVVVDLLCRAPSPIRRR